MFDPTSAQPRYQQGECPGYVMGVDDGVRAAFDIVDKPQPYCGQVE
jgi:hypothetical protein